VSTCHHLLSCVGGEEHWKEEVLTKAMVSRALFYPLDRLVSVGIWASRRLADPIWQPANAGS
jgi:hypothetical protein